MTKAVIGLAVSVLLAGFMIASAIERNTPRYSLMGFAGKGLFRLDVRTGTVAGCDWFPPAQNPQTMKCN